MGKLTGLREQRHQPLWDSLVRDDATGTIATKTTLFGNTNVGSFAKSNLDQAGGLASDQTFVALSLRCYVQVGTAAIFRKVVDELYFNFVIGDKSQFQAPVWYAPAGGGCFGYDSAAATLNNGVPSHEAVLKLAKPAPIVARQHFKVEMEFFKLTTSDARASLSASSARKIITFVIDGIQTRDVQ